MYYTCSFVENFHYIKIWVKHKVKTLLYKPLDEPIKLLFSWYDS